MPAVFLWTFKKGSCSTFFENLHGLEKSVERDEERERKRERKEIKINHTTKNIKIIFVTRESPPCIAMPNVSRERKWEINIKRSRFNASTQLGLIYTVWHWLSCLFRWRLVWLWKRFCQRVELSWVWFEFWAVTRNSTFWALSLNIC